jgi:release factor glutamine methyltransferase
MTKADRPWTTRRLLAWTTEYFQRKGLDNPRLAAEMLMAHVLGVPRIRLFMDMDRPASPGEKSAFRDLVERAARHEPVDYLVGQAPFYSLMLEVNPSVLVPRPSTETLVDHVISHVRATPGFHSPFIADVGTGSGAIAIAVAKNLPGCRILATDLSERALEVARRNAARHGVADRIDFAHGDLLEPLAGRRFHFLLSNPPYISDAEWLEVAPNVKDYEPVTALRGGADGLEYIRPLIARADGHLEESGHLAIEIAASQKQAVLELATAAGNLTNLRVLADHEALPRVLVAEKR